MIKIGFADCFSPSNLERSELADLFFLIFTAKLPPRSLKWGDFASFPLMIVYLISALVGNKQRSLD